MTSILAYAFYSMLANPSPETATEVRAGPHPLVRGAVVADHALVFGGVEPVVHSRDGRVKQPGQPPWLQLDSSRLNPKSDAIVWFGTVGFLRVALAGGPPECFSIGRHAGTLGWINRPGPVPLRWRVAGGVLHHVAYSPDFLERRPPGWLPWPSAYVRGVPLTAGLLAACRLGPETEGVGWEDRRGDALVAGWEANPGPSLKPVDLRFGYYYADPPVDRRPEPELWRTHFDFHTADGKRFELFISAPGGLARHNPLPDRFEPIDGTWRKCMEKVSVDHPPAWVGPFYVAADGDDRHFIVPGGRVFSLPADAKPGTALVKTWDADPVLALVHDADAGKSYAFTKSQYFHVTAKPAPKPHGLTAFPGATADEALDTVAKCGRVVRGLAP